MDEYVAKISPDLVTLGNVKFQVILYLDIFSAVCLKGQPNASNNELDHSDWNDEIFSLDLLMTGLLF